MTIPQEIQSRLIMYVIDADCMRRVKEIGELIGGELDRISDALLDKLIMMPHMRDAITHERPRMKQLQVAAMRELLKG